MISNCEISFKELVNGTQDIENITVRLVKDNRLFTQFDIAYGMVAQVFMQLKPFLVEGTYWIAEPLLMNIPELKTQRGRYAGLLDGSPLEIDRLAQTTLKNWYSLHDIIFWHSIALSEASYTQKYLLSIEKYGEEREKKNAFEWRNK